jgi:hypothetical protein
VYSIEDSADSVDEDEVSVGKEDDDAEDFLTIGATRYDVWCKTDVIRGLTPEVKISLLRCIQSFVAYSRTEPPYQTDIKSAQQDPPRKPIKTLLRIFHSLIWTPHIFWRFCHEMIHQCLGLGVRGLALFEEDGELIVLGSNEFGREGGEIVIYYGIWDSPPPMTAVCQEEIALVISSFDSLDELAGCPLDSLFQLIGRFTILIPSKCKVPRLDHVPMPKMIRIARLMDMDSSGDLGVCQRRVDGDGWHSAEGGRLR